MGRGPCWQGSAFPDGREADWATLGGQYGPGREAGGGASKIGQRTTRALPDAAFASALAG